MSIYSYNIEFKQAYVSGNLEDCNVWTESFVYDPSTDSGADNWLLLDTSPSSEEDAAIAKGDSSVTDGEGNELKQADALTEMQNLAADLKETAKEDPTEKTFNDAVEKTPGASDILEKAEDILETGKVPDGNTGDEIDHRHNEDGSVTTVFIPETNPEQPAEQPTEQPAAQITEE